MYEPGEDLAADELKRIDHLIFVTLKYTRTVDIIRTILQKFILAIDYKVEQYYDLKLEEKRIDKIPLLPLMRIRDLEKRYKKNSQVKDMVDFYVSLKRICNAEYRPREEYRKNVTLVTKEDEVNIAHLREYVELVKEYIDLVGTLEK